MRDNNGGKTINCTQLCTLNQERDTVNGKDRCCRLQTPPTLTCKTEFSVIFLFRAGSSLIQWFRQIRLAMEVRC